MSTTDAANLDGTSAATSSVDVIDDVLNIDASHPLYEIRQGRKKVVVAMQKNYDAFFAPESGGLNLKVRLLVAWYACALSNCQLLTQHYAKRLESIGINQSELQALLGDNSLGSINEDRLEVILLFTRKLILNPVEGDEQEIQKLRQAGVETPDIVTLAQLIAFLSYQIRVVIGFVAMKERLEK